MMNLEQLNSPVREERLAAVRAIGERCKEGVMPTLEVNNHVHSIYSFSPYSPSRIAVEAGRAGLQTVGIMDHDSVAGCEELIEAAKAVNMACTVGFEMRVNMDNTAVQGRRTNNPDEPNVSYIAVHGIPRNRLPAAEAFLAPLRAARLARCRSEVEKLNGLLAGRGAPQLDFDQDVLAISEAAGGGTVTERHILYALSCKMIETHGKGAALVDYVVRRMGVPLNGTLMSYLMDTDNPHYAYDLLGAFKSQLVPEFFIRSGIDECIPVHEAVQFANRIGAIPAYAYLGDVGESPTADKKAETFEDGYLDVLISELKRIGFRAVTYMPPRNSRMQLMRLQKLCRENGLMEISGVDINSSRQSFNCPVLLEPEFRHLADAAWALIAHEKLADIDPARALFSPANPLAGEPLDVRITRYAGIGRRMNHARPEEAGTLIGDGI